MLPDVIRNNNIFEVITVLVSVNINIADGKWQPTAPERNPIHITKLLMKSTKV